MASLLNLDYLKVFYFVAKYQNITKAAQELYMSQPAATRTIHQLENQMGCSLFVRFSRGVSLTPAGAILYQALIPAMDTIEKAQDKINQMLCLEKGVVNVSVNNLASEYILKQASDIFCRRYPGISIITSRLVLEKTQVALENHWIDFALHLDMGDSPDQSVIIQDKEDFPRIKQQVIGDFFDVFLVGPQYAEMSRQIVTPEHLAQLPLIVPLEAHVASKYYLELVRGSETPTPVDITVNGAESRLALVQRNMGATHFPAEFVSSQLANGEMYRVNIDLPMRVNTLSVISPELPLPNIAAQRFLEMLMKLNGNI